MSGVVIEVINVGVVVKATVPVVAGKVRTISLPAIALGCKDTFPDVEPANRTTPREVPARPTSNSAHGAFVPIPTLPLVMLKTVLPFDGLIVNPSPTPVML